VIDSAIIKKLHPAIKNIIASLDRIEALVKSWKDKRFSVPQDDYNGMEKYKEQLLKAGKDIHSEILGPLGNINTQAVIIERSEFLKAA